MQAMRAVRPELHPLRLHSIAAPTRRSRHVLAVEAAGEILEPLLKRRAGIERSRLVRSPGPEVGIARPAGEIGIGFGVADGVDGTFYAHLPPQRLPMEEQGGMRVRGNLRALP